MDIKTLLQPFFENAGLLLPGSSLVAATLARIVYAALNEAGFDIVRSVELLGKLGFKVGKALMPELIEAAKTGIKGLTKWFEVQLASSPEVNEAGAKLLLEQAEPITTAAQEGLPEEKDEVADTMKAGLEQYGGATAEIADPYADVMKDLSKLDRLAVEMRQKIEVWASQIVEAKRGSLIENVDQTIEGGSGGKQAVQAEDESIVSGVRQVIRGKPASKNK